MSTNNRTSGSIRQTFGWVSLLTIIYVLEVLLLPYQKNIIQSYHWSSFEYRDAVLMVNLPVIVVWFVAFWGYHKLKQYAEAINKTAEGEHFQKLALGSTWLAWSLPINSIISRLLRGIADAHRSFDSAATIILNYESLTITLIAFLIISSASRGIMGSNKLNFRMASIRYIMLLFVAGGVLYCYLTLKAFDLTSLSSTHNPYHLAAWLMIISVIIPYLYSWFIGMLAAFEITIYSRQIKGVLYKRALHKITGGLLAIVLSFISIQYLDTVWPIPGHLVFNSRLVIMTLFKIIGGIGFVLAAIGANQLKKIEEV
jgi:hypothetical protein